MKCEVCGKEKAIATLGEDLNGETYVCTECFVEIHDIMDASSEPEDSESPEKNHGS